MDKLRGTVRNRDDLGIEALRGVAIILMVAGHVIGASASQGLAVPDESGWRFLSQALEDLRMPLFTVLSGFLFAYRPVMGLDGFGGLLKGKTRRLIVPFVTVTTLFYITKALVPGANENPKLEDIWLAYLFGYEHLWFLQAVMICFLVAGALDAAGALASVRSWAVITGSATAVYVFVEIPSHLALFSADGTLRLVPFFMLGFGCRRFGYVLSRPRVAVVALSLFVPLYIIRLWVIVFDVAIEARLDRCLSVAVAASGIMVALMVRRLLVWRPLVWIGGFSYGVYLLHVFGAAGSRIFAERLGVVDIATLFSVGLMAGLALPIVFELVFGRCRLVSLIVLGQMPSGRAKEGG